MTKRTLEERFWAKVDKSGGPEACWGWLGSSSPSQHCGKFWLNGRDHSAHRIAWRLAKGTIPNGLRILHRCGNLYCVNPAHLFLRGQGEAAERFWEKVDRRGDEECWPWTGALGDRNYGVFRVSPGDKRVATRFAWELARGSIPEGLFVCHHCDNPPCVNPAHLFLGSNMDNVQDMMRKERNQRGSGHYRAQLSESLVREIRIRYAAGETIRTISQALGASRTAVWKVATGRNWKHVL